MANPSPMQGIPHIVGVGGTFREGSSSERALRVALDECGRLGATTSILQGDDLDLPMYRPGRTVQVERAGRLIEELRQANGLILSTPSYHGSLSGAIKNAIDYIEGMRSDPRPYLDGKAVGIISSGAGWQGGVATLAAMRSIVHALRGWPTPLGVVINTVAAPLHNKSGQLANKEAASQLGILASHVVEGSVLALNREQRSVSGNAP